MPKQTILVASDSFKGSLSSLDICDLFKGKLKDKDISLLSVPIADGGEGSLTSISNIIDGSFVNIEVTDLYFKKRKVQFFITKDDAYIECASCVGLTQAHRMNNPGKVTTYGLGEQIKKAIELGKKNIYIFLGGSASNDGGAGLASALGVHFFNEHNEIFIPVGLTLKDISKIDTSQSDELIKDIKITVLSDVKSPLYGIEGAAWKFAKQKGATPNEIRELDYGLTHLANIIYKDTGIDPNIPGGGAAGGLGGGIYSLLHGQIKSGISTLLDLIDFDSLIEQADIVVSGEGKLDKQTLDGKVVDGIARSCLKHDKPLYLIVGISNVPHEEIKKIYSCIKYVYETNDKHLPFRLIKWRSKFDYQRKIDRLLKVL